MCKTKTGSRVCLAHTHLGGRTRVEEGSVASRTERVTFEFLSLNIPVRSFVRLCLGQQSKKGTEARTGRGTCGDAVISSGKVKIICAE